MLLYLGSMRWLSRLDTTKNTATQAIMAPAMKRPKERPMTRPLLVVVEELEDVYPAGDAGGGAGRE
jgi:hypothetical protein